MMDNYGLNEHIAYPRCNKIIIMLWLCCTYVYDYHVIIIIIIIFETNKRHIQTLTANEQPYLNGI